MEEQRNNPLIDTIISLSGMIKLALVIVVMIILFLILMNADFMKMGDEPKMIVQTSRWTPPTIKEVPRNDSGSMIKYGYELIAHTSEYFGPNGKVISIGNGMSCTNCHLDAGTKHLGNNFSAVSSTYPKFRPRYGGIESIAMRVNDCITRSLNSQKLDTTSREMRAIVSYMNWLGKDVERGTVPEGAGLVPLVYMNRAAIPENGKRIYEEKCINCHGASGEGMMNADSTSWLNPPVWGDNSYSIGAGMFRLSRLAGFVKANMPWGTTYESPRLSDEEAWDVAAYINSMPRPSMNLEKDWPDIAKKPVDYPFGPFIDGFKEVQHKYGPYNPIVKAQENLIRN